MILGLTIARKGDKWEVVTDPNVPFSEQRRDFKQLVVDLAESHDEVQLVSTSMGRVRRKKFNRGKVASAEELAASVKEIQARENEPKNGTPSKGNEDETLI